MTVKLDETTHTYILPDGRVVPGVTEVLKDQGLLVISEWSTGPETGSAVHSAVHEIETNCYLPEYNPEYVYPYVEQYRRFKDAVDFQCKASEMLVCSEAYRYAGTLDLLGLIHCDRSLVDIKTGVENPATAVQVAAYWQALPPKIKAGVKCYTLYLKPDRYNLVPIEPFDLLNASHDFVAALRTYKFREQHGLLNSEE